MAGISSKASKGNGYPENKKKFTSQGLDDDFGLNLYQMRFRNMDPQIGRFVQIDPLAADYVHNSTYAYAENDVIRAIDVEGLEKYVVTMNQIGKKSNISKVTVTQVQSQGKAQDNAIKFKNDRRTPTKDVLVSTDDANINGSKISYLEKPELNEGEKRIRDKGKREIDEKNPQVSVKEDGEEVGAGIRFESPGDKLIISNGYASGITTTTSAGGKITNFNDAIGVVFEQIADLKSQIKNIDTKTMVITLTTKEQNAGTMQIVKEFIENEYKGSKVNVVTDDNSGALKKKNSAFNSTIYAVEKQ